jgi:hypothetical protein
MASSRRAYIKDPGSDPIIAMSRDRRAKELQQEKQRREVSGLSGEVLHKQMELSSVLKEIKTLEEGVQEYQDRIDLLTERKNDIKKGQVQDRAWCATFDEMIGPFEAKYEECKAEVKVSFDHAKTKYHESLQKLIDDFGFHPAFKRCARRPSSVLLAMPSSSPPCALGHGLSSCLDLGHAWTCVFAGGLMSFDTFCLRSIPPTGLSWSVSCTVVWLREACS